MIAAVSTWAQVKGRSFAIKVLLISCIRSAPITVPMTFTLPPLKGVPPSTTAVIAESSIRRPMLDGSLAPRRAVATTPAKAARRPLITYTARSVLRTGCPDKKLAERLPPMATTYLPNVVRFTKKPTTSTAATATITGAGIPKGRPCPSHRITGSVTSKDWPPAKIWASPLPPTSMARVAMIGCTPTKATRLPFTSPARAPTRSATDNPIGHPYPRYSGRKAEARAITDPTERSMPSVPIASATPKETRTMGETVISRVESVATEAKLGVTMRLKITSTTNATYTPRPRTQEVTVEMSKALFGVVPLSIDALSVLVKAFVRIVAMREHLHQVTLGDLLLREQSHHGAVSQCDHAIAALRDLFQLRGDEDDTQSLRREIVHELLYLRLGSHVDAAGRLVQYKNLGVHAHPAGQKHFLLVAARELPDRLVWARSLDAEALHEFPDQLVLRLLRDQSSPRQPRQGRGHDVLPHREIRDDALQFAVLG